MNVLEIFIVVVQVLSQDTDLQTLADLKAGKLMGDELYKIGQRCNEPKVSMAFATLFDTEFDFYKKLSIASVLVRYRSSDARYFAYLRQEAAQAVDSDAPMIYKVDASGSVVRGERNPQFEKWCQERGIDVLVESRRQLVDYPSILSSLAFGADRRAISIFLKGLDSENPLVITTSASGLAEVDYVESITAILLAAGRSKVRIDGVVAIALTRFEKSEAEVRSQLRGSPLLPVYEEALKYQHEHRRKFPPPSPPAM